MYTTKSLDTDSEIELSVYKLVEEIKSSILDDPEREKAFISEITAECLYFPEETDEPFDEFSKRFKAEKHPDKSLDITTSLMIRVPLFRKQAVEGLTEEQQRKVDAYAASLALQYIESMLLENAYINKRKSQSGGEESSVDKATVILERFYQEQILNQNGTLKPSELAKKFKSWYKTDPDANALIDSIITKNSRSYLKLRAEKKIGSKTEIPLKDRWTDIIKKFG